MFIALLFNVLQIIQLYVILRIRQLAIGVNLKFY